MQIFGVRSHSRPAPSRREPRFPTSRPPLTAAVRRRAGHVLRPVASAPDIAFLLRQGIPETVLVLATRLSALRGTLASDELLAGGFDRQRYWAMLAADLGLPFAPNLDGVALIAHADFVTTEAIRSASAVLVKTEGATTAVVAPAADEIASLRARLNANPPLASRIRIAAPETIRAFLVAKRHTALTHYAVNRLSRVMPRLSARSLDLSQGPRGPVALAAALAGLCLLAPSAALAALGLLGTLFFANCGAWKLAAAFARPRQLRLQPASSKGLPTYTVLVPLYHEAAIVPDLVKHLVALDYPLSKLQILILLETDDAESRAAVARHAVSPVMEVIVVPPGGPRTKPKALTYALPFARGDLVVVFDAEDRPEADQLRKAASAFREYPALGCVQARLCPDNPESWLARMFMLEYAANFEILLPALAGLHVPLPLGGTSNHFPRAVLEKISAWDPFNVTEDAELGVRLARFGYQTATILSRTYEEAPVTFRQWLPQRRRWIKGWMQTSLLCLAGRAPAALRLSVRESFAVHGIISAGVLGLLLFPISVVVVALAAAAFLGGNLPDTIWMWSMLVLNGLNFVAILVAAMVSALRGLRAAGALRLALLIPLLPFYWTLMSLAAWQALAQFLKEPSRWEKTRHGVARDRRTPRMPHMAY